MKPTDTEMQLLNVLHWSNGLMSHDDEALSKFCDDTADLDVFNACHQKGWLTSTHDMSTDNSTVRLTDVGKARLYDHHKRFFK